jgi:RNA-directed DNA polymerase
VSSRPPDPLSDVPQWFSSDDLFSTLNRPRGIPIGNLTSQFFANIYLHELDAFVKYELREKYYIRYVDDLVILGNDKKHLRDIKEQIRDFLQTLRLKLHPKKSNVFPVRVGTDFLGYRIYPNHSRIRKENVKRFITRTKRLQLDYSCGKITLDRVRSSIHSWLGHAKHADSYRLRRKLLGNFHFVRKNVHVY